MQNCAYALFTFKFYAYSGRTALFLSPLAPLAFLMISMAATYISLDNITTNRGQHTLNLKYGQQINHWKKIGKLGLHKHLSKNLKVSAKREAVGFGSVCTELQFVFEKLN